MKRLILLLILLSTIVCAADRKNPTSKAYISAVEGTASVVIQDGSIQNLSNRGVYNAEGLIFDTKEKSNEAMVLSNGSGIYMDESTHLEINRFAQEPFNPDRSDLDVEPSISLTRGFISHGYVAICTPKIVAGSSMVYETPNGKVRLFNNKVAISVDSNKTEIISISGEVSVESGISNYQCLKNGEKAIIKGGKISVENVTKEELKTASDHITSACVARQVVYFDVASKKDAAEADELKVIPLVPAKENREVVVSPARLWN